MKKLLATIAAAIMLLPAILSSGCGDRPPSSSAAPAQAIDAKPLNEMPVAVASPYLEVALLEMAGRKLPLVRLAGPSMCPGHFDMRPSQLSELSRCGLLVRFDFQKPLDDKLPRLRAVAPISVHDGLCVPDAYFVACQQVAAELTRAGFLSQKETDARLTALAARMDTLRQKTERQIEAGHLRGVPVLASGHQADFCRWLGLRVVGQTSNADSCSIRDLNEALKAAEAAGVKLIVANEPEGRRAADALAERIEATVVVLANFPDPDKPAAFDELLAKNVAALLKANRTNRNEP